jgi:hypothetical protein
MTSSKLTCPVESCEALSEGVLRVLGEVVSAWASLSLLQSPFAPSFVCFSDALSPGTEAEELIAAIGTPFAGATVGAVATGTMLTVSASM